MKKILLFACAATFATTINTHAQEIKYNFGANKEASYNWGEMHHNSKPLHHMDRILSHDETGFDALREFKSGFDYYYWIERYDNGHNLVSANEIVFPKGILGESSTLESIEVVNNNYYGIATNWSKSKGEHSLDIRTISSEGLLGDPILLDKTSAKKMGNKGFFHTAFSEDGTKLLTIAEGIYEKDTKEKLRLKCYEVGTFKELWSKDIALESPSQKAPHNHIAVDNNGNAMMYKKYRIKKLWYHQLFTCAKGGKWGAHNIELGEKIMLDWNMAFNSDNDFVFSGTYTLQDKPGVKDINGRFFYRVDHNTMELAVNLVTPLEEKILAMRLSEKQIAKENPAIEYYDVVDVLARSDGKMLILLEMRKESREGVAEATTPLKYDYEWYSGSLIVLCVNKEGKIDWTQSIRKAAKVNVRATAAQAYNPWGGFVWTFENDNLNILYNQTPLSFMAIPRGHWFEEGDETKYLKFKTFAPNTGHATFMRVVQADGSLKYGALKYGLPLIHMHNDAPTYMTMDANVFFPTEKGVIIYSHIGNGAADYRFGEVIFE